MEQNQITPANFFEQYSKHLQETNRHLSRIGNLLVGVLIAKGIVAIFVIVVVSKISSYNGM
jgi:hypothetical protein